MNAEDSKIERMNAIFDGDGTNLRQQFIYAGLLLTIFERFKRFVVDRVDGFFSKNIEIKEGNLKYSRGEEFKIIIKARGLGQSGQHTNREFRAALNWFQDLGAIEKDEFDEVERLYTLRNEVGHELLRIIAFDGKPITLFDVIFSFAMYVKIIRWWVKEIEAATDPDFDEEKYLTTDWDGIESIETIMLREIMEKTLSDDPAWLGFQAVAKEASEEDHR